MLLSKRLTKIMIKKLNYHNFIKCKSYFAVYRSYTTTKTNIQRLDDPIILKRMAKHNRHAVHNHNSKDLEYDLTSQKRTRRN